MRPDAAEWENALARLCRASAADRGDNGMDWPDRIDHESWCMSPELVSVGGTPWYESLDEAGKRKVSFHEAVNFFSLNVHGEKALIAGLAGRLYGGDRIRGRAARPRAYDEYLHHFLEEENRHMGWFGGFCMRYHGSLYADKKIPLPSGGQAASGAPGEEDFLFFAKVLVFEEIVDVFNLRCAKDDRLHPLVRRINALHHRDESRHLAFGRQAVRELFSALAPEWDAGTLGRIRGYLAGYVGETLKEYYNPQAYRDAGFPGNALELRAGALAHPAGLARRELAAKSCLDFLIKQGILEAYP